MNILHLTNSINPANGGPAACVRALTTALAGLGHPSEIACLDAPDAPHLRSVNAPVHAFGPAGSGYDYAPGLLRWLFQAAGRFDAVIIHGLWQYPGLAAQLALRTPGSPRRYVFPHGMLDPWFKRTHPLKHLRKWIYWWLVERRLLVASEAVLFTCAEERRLARRAFPASTYQARVVAFGTTTPPEATEAQRDAFLKIRPGPQNAPFWLFLGRIHPKKGVELLIDAYAALVAERSGLPRLVIAGPCASPAYLAQLQARAARLCPDGPVFWPGMLSGNAKWGALRAAEAFVLPSHQENFGIAVVEALACRTPVLLSDQVNIWREIVDDGAGLAAPDTPAGILDLLRRWLDTRPGERRAMRDKAIACFEHRYEMGAVARSLIAVLETAPETRRSAILGPAQHP